MLSETCHLQQAFWWRLLERQDLPGNSGVRHWTSEILLCSASYLAFSVANHKLRLQGVGASVL